VIATNASAMSVAFRPLKRSDFALVARWLEEPLVARWWNHETSAEAVERDFGPSVDGRDATQVLLAAVEDRAFGLVQRYPIAAYPEYVQELAAVHPVPVGALSIDYLIGVPAMRGRGLGAAMIAAAVADCWTAFPDADDVLVPVAAGNTASWRALERAGFTRVAEGLMEPDNPRDPRDHVVYRARRPRGPGTAPSG
jgi:aminoglycoside 6'-N-acetyltransferase